jgi:hypothetical protein
MNYLLFILGIFISQLSIAQITNPFPNQNFTNWYGDTTLILFENDWLKANDTDASTSLLLWTPLNPLTNSEWETEIKLDFNPSSSNHLLIYLYSDQPLNQSDLQAYYLKIGGASGYADAIDLYKQNGKTHTKIISGKTGYIGLDQIHIQVKVQYYKNGMWRLYADSTANSNFLLQGEAIEKTILTQGFAGFNFIHTATRKDKFYFKSLSINDAPTEILEASAINPTLISISVSKHNILENSDISFFINSQKPQSIDQVDQNLIITLKDPLLEGINTVSIVSENVNLTKAFIFTPPLEISNIVIHEIMADPTPIVGLPEYEYVELFNKSTKPVNLKNYTFADKTSIGTITDDLIIEPDSFLILCSKEASEYFSNIGNTYSLNTWPSLNNDTDYLQLRNGQGVLIDEIEYFKTWHKSTAKAEGGHSLELINTESLCSGKNNWTSSESDKGGTPGKDNSVKAISSAKQLNLKSYEIHTDSIKMVFDNEIFWSQKILIYLDEKPIHHYDISENKLTFNTPFSLSPNSVYHIRFTKQRNCSSQEISDTNFELIFPVQANLGDLLINEILFKAKTGGTDFVEIYNNSNNYIDLNHVELAYRSSSSDSLIKYKLAEKTHIIEPKSFKILTKDSTKLATVHPNTVVEAILQMAKFPSLNDVAGEIHLNSPQTPLDLAWYNAKQHSPLITDPKGVSLERVSYSSSSTDLSNWYSAGSGVDYATPGFENSQAKVFSELDKEFFIDPPVFSPDGDGYQDLVFIRYKLVQEGYLASIQIFDTQGRFINEIANNLLLGTDGFVSWDGSTNKGYWANIGMYLIIIELFHPSGGTKKIRETVVLGAQN